jgi:hypothetical protein
MMEWSMWEGFLADQFEMCRKLTYVGIKDLIGRSHGNTKRHNFKRVQAHLFTLTDSLTHENLRHTLHLSIIKNQGQLRKEETFFYILLSPSTRIVLIGQQG